VRDPWLCMMPSFVRNAMSSVIMLACVEYFINSAAQLVKSGGCLGDPWLPLYVPCHILHLVRSGVTGLCEISLSIYS
jgi:hypothetical protein